MNNFEEKIRKNRKSYQENSSKDKPDLVKQNFESLRKNLKSDLSKQNIKNDTNKESEKDLEKEVKEKNETNEKSDDKNDKNLDSNQNPETNKKSKKKISFIILILLILASYFFGVFYFQDKYKFNTKINDINLSLKTVKEANKKFIKDFNNKNLDVNTPDNKTITLNYEKANVMYNPQDELLKKLKKQNKWLWFIPAKNENIKGEIQVDSDSLKQSYSKKLVSHLPNVKLDDYIKYDDGKQKYKLASKNNKKVKLYIIDNIILEIKKAFENSKNELDIKPVKEVNKSMQKIVDRVNKSIKSDIPIKFGNINDSIDKKYIAMMISINSNGIKVDDDKLAKTLAELAKSHQRIEDSKVYAYDPQLLRKQIKDDIEHHSSKKYIARENTIPLGVNNGKGTLNLGGTYIEVNTKAQALYAWKNSKLVNKFNVITGDVSKGRPTTIGVHQIWNKEKNKILKGSTVGVGKDYDYSIPVAYWMPIDDTGIGIHSIDVDEVTGNKGRIYWGKDAYQIGKGSHGCINMHTDEAKWIFNNMPMFTKVYVTP